jgi:hypothetical protein
MYSYGVGTGWTPNAYSNQITSGTVTAAVAVVQNTTSVVLSTSAFWSIASSTAFTADGLAAANTICPAGQGQKPNAQQTTKARRGITISFPMTATDTNFRLGQRACLASCIPKVIKATGITASAHHVIGDQIGSGMLIFVPFRNNAKTKA